MTKPKTNQTRLYGGPMDGRTIELPRGVEKYVVMRSWTYRYAGKKDGIQFFALWPRQRKWQRFTMLYMMQTGKHPLVAFADQRPQPIRRDGNRSGQGAAKRAAARIMRSTSA